MTDAVLAEAEAGLDPPAGCRGARWMPEAAALAGASGPSGASAVPAADAVLAMVRERLADDLDAPGAVAAVDAWADAVLAGLGARAEDAALIRDTVDALLGVAL